MGLQISETELTVQKTERKSMKSAVAWIFRDYIGEEFDGVINGFDSYGIYVLVHTEKIYGEGWISLSKLKDDYYEYDEESLRIVGKRRKKVYQMRQKVRIRVDSADPVGSKVDFDLVGAI